LAAGDQGGEWKGAFVLLRGLRATSGKR